MRRLIWMVIVAAMLVPGMATAQSTPEAMHDGVAGYLPEDEDIGVLWHWSGPWEPTITDAEYIVDAAGAEYVGDLGQRARIIIVQHQRSRAAVSEAWGNVTAWADWYADNGEFELDSEPRTAGAPDGTIDAYRYAGRLTLYPLNVCIGAYAIDPDIMVFVRFESSVYGSREPAVVRCDAIASDVAARVAG